LGENNMPNQGMLYSTSLIAKLFNVTERTISNLTNDGIISKAERGKYELVPTIQKYVKYLQEKAFGKNISSGDYHGEKTAHERIKRQIAELELAKLRSQMLDADIVERVMSEMIVIFRNKILGIPQKLAPVLINIDSTSEVYQILNKEMREALLELAEYDPALFVEGESIEGRDTDTPAGI
jgi:phage terminase Nu1 subunit (DNA packaging protein)